MKIKKLTFHEQYLDKEPKENYWRGISGYVDDRCVFQINYYPKNKFEPAHFEFNSSLLKHSDYWNDLRITKYTKEEAKKHAQEIFEKYINSFIE